MALFLSFLVIKILMSGIKSPYELAFSIKKIAYKNNYLSKLLREREKKIEKKILKLVEQGPVVRYARADEKKVVFYKGKKLIIFTSDASKDIPDEFLEFFYKLELEREKQTKK